MVLHPEKKIIMKQFFKFMFASMLGYIIGAVLLTVIVIAIIASIASSAGDREIIIDEASVLHIYFKAPLRDRSPESPFDNFDFTNLRSGAQPGLNDILKNIAKAAVDPKIKGIYIDLSGLNAGIATAEEIRNALSEFKKSKKFIYAYSDYYSQGTYLLASVADQVWMNPEGTVEINGFVAQIPFFKGTLEKLEIEPQVIRHGKFKSAVEPLIMDKMSDENRAQVASYVNALWNRYRESIAASRKISPEEVQQIADSFSIRRAEDALRLKIVDKLAYKDEFLGLLKKETGKDNSDELKLVSLKRYKDAKDPAPEKEFTRDRIAVVYASGNIVGGKGNADEIGSETVSEAIRKARENEKVKALVLRVNSPGGDALASEVIWREVSECSKVKPVIVSMGDLAASGGYYISCAADTIVAQPTTLTGSIGVFGVIFNTQKLMNNSLGITFDSYKTSPYADIGTPFRPLSEPEKQIIQGSVEDVYNTFTKRVSDGRNIPVSTVDSLGQGRVWSGSDALKLGLVDVLGGLETAIEIAAKKAGVTNYRITELPELKEPFTQVMEELSGDAESVWMKNKLGDFYDLYRTGEELKKLQGIQARTFYSFELN